MVNKSLSSVFDAGSGEQDVLKSQKLLFVDVPSVSVPEYLPSLLSQAQFKFLYRVDGGFSSVGWVLV